MAIQGGFRDVTGAKDVTASPREKFFTKSICLVKKDLIVGKFSRLASF